MKASTALAFDEVPELLPASKVARRLGLSTTALLAGVGGLAGAGLSSRKSGQAQVQVDQLYDATHRPAVAS